MVGALPRNIESTAVHDGESGPGLKSVCVEADTVVDVAAAVISFSEPF